MAITHTHGSFDAINNNYKDGFSSPNDVLSGNEKMSDSYNSDSSGIDYYVITPNGNHRFYKANSGNYDGELLSTEMYKDPRIDIYNRYKDTLLWKQLKLNFKNADEQDFVNALNDNDNILEAVKSLEEFR